MELSFYIDKLKNTLSEKRYNHSIRVMETAIDLAVKYGADINKVTIASILHDYAKEYSRDELEQICSTHFYEETKDFIGVTLILHGFVGAHIAKNEFNISDEEILNAIKYHTIGRENMSLVEKIVYIADAIEPERDYSHVNQIRELIKNDLDAAILFEVNKKMEYLLEKNSIIQMETLHLRNWLIKGMSKWEGYFEY